MKSLSALNRFSNKQVIYTDERPYALTVSADASNQTVTVGEDQAHQVPSTLTFSALQSVPGNVVMTVDTGNVGNIYITWSDASLPQGITYSNPSTGIHRLTGLNGIAAYETWSAPFIVAKDRETDWNYSANVTFPNPLDTPNTIGQSWTIAVTVANTHSELSAASSINFVEDQAVINLTGTPTITDEYVLSGTYTLTITPSTTSAVYLMSSTGNANSSFNSTSKVLTLTGTAAEVNDNLDNISLYPASDFASNFSLVYSLTNPISSLITNQTQNFTCTATNSEYSISDFDFYQQVDNEIAFEILEEDDTIEYTITFDQIDGVDGQFKVNGVNAANPLVLTGDKNIINALTITWRPSIESLGDTEFEYTQIKHSSQGDLVQASGVPFTGNYIETFVLTNPSINYAEDNPVPLTFTLDDPDTINFYNLVIEQTSPAQTEYPGQFVFHTTLTQTDYLQDQANDGGSLTGYFDLGANLELTFDQGNSANIKSQMTSMGNAVSTGTFYPPSGGRIWYYPPSDYTGNISLQATLVKNTTADGNVTFYPPSNHVYNLTCNNTSDSSIVVNTGNVYTAYSGGLQDAIGSAAPKPAKISITVGDYDKRQRYFNQAAEDYNIYYKLTQLSPSPANVQTAGISYLSTKDGSGNVVILSGEAYAWADPNPFRIANAVTTNSATSTAYTAYTDIPVAGNTVASVNANGYNFVYYAPPGYTGNVSAQLDVYKIRNGETIPILDAYPITITVPELNAGISNIYPGSNLFAAVSTTTTTASTNSVVLIKDLALSGYEGIFYDPAGELISWDGDTSFTDERVNCRYNITISDSSGLGQFGRYNSSTSTFTPNPSDTTKYSAANVMQTSARFDLTGDEGPFVSDGSGPNLTNLLAYKTGNTTGNVTFNLTVDRLQYANAAFGGSLVANVRTVDNPTWGAGGVTIQIT